MHYNYTTNSMLTQQSRLILVNLKKISILYNTTINLSMNLKYNPLNILSLNLLQTITQVHNSDKN